MIASMRLGCSVLKCQQKLGTIQQANKMVGWKEEYNPEMWQYQHENGTQVHESHGSAPARLAHQSETIPTQALQPYPPALE